MCACYQLVCVWSCLLWSKALACSSGVLLAMKYSQLAFFVTALLSSYGEIPLIKLTHFQEECSGCGALTAGVREYSFKALNRDVS